MIDVEKAIIAMASGSVDFVLIGGVALTIHSAAYITYDTDFCFARNQSNLERIANPLDPFRPRLRNLPVDLPFIWDSSTLADGSVFTLETSVGDIDLRSEVAGIGTYEDVVRESVVFPLYGFDVQVLSIDGLIKAKTAAGREKDIPGLKHLEAIKAALSDEEP